VVSGATILGNGTVALILDPHRLVQNVVQSLKARRNHSVDRQNSNQTFKKETITYGA
jgi:chemotaxis protein histidine kinase CheA